MQTLSVQTDAPVNPNIIAPPPDVRLAEQKAGKYLIFRLGAEEFGISVLQAREILSLQEITAVPNTPEHIKGVINLRGKIIPVVELRRKFNMDPAEYSSNTCIIVAQVNRGTESMQIGMVVDSVCEVATLHAGEIEDAPDFGEQVETPWLMGIARKKNGVRILLHVDQVLSATELNGLHSVSQRKN
jgi:purine-binding chemotaxis protein CheW